jgi:splicing factor 3B subunit 2
MVRCTPASEVNWLTRLRFTEEEEEESEEEEEGEEEEAVETQADGLQTPSGLETPSGMASVVSTVAGGLETPDFLELRKNASRVSDVGDSSSRSLYQVVPERQTSVRGLMGSDRGYDIGGVSGAPRKISQCLAKNAVRR